MTILGAPGCAWKPTIDGRGVIEVGDQTIECWYGADDRWHLPTDDALNVRQERLGAAPITETRTRVPGGDAVQRAWTVPDQGGVTVVEVENDSPAPFVVAFVVRTRSRRGAIRTLRVEDADVVVDERVVMRLPRSPKRWETSGSRSTRDDVVGGRAREGTVQPVSGSGIEGAFLFPVPHRTILRIALGDDVVTDPMRSTARSDVEQGWDRLLDRGLRVELPGPLQTAVDQARADALFALASPETFIALEAWGFDAEARDMWSRMSLRERRRAQKRRVETSPLMEVYDALVRVEGERIELLPGFRTEWLGQSIAVHDVPLGNGTLSFALRWHGARPALLWEAPEGAVLSAPALDPAWRGAGGAGETLLSEPPAPLLAMGTGARDGDAVDAPESFS